MRVCSGVDSGRNILVPGCHSCVERLGTKRPSDTGSQTNEEGVGRAETNEVLFTESCPESICMVPARPASSTRGQLRVSLLAPCSTSSISSSSSNGQYRRGSRCWPPRGALWLSAGIWWGARWVGTSDSKRIWLALGPIRRSRVYDACLMFQFW